MSTLIATLLLHNLLSWSSSGSFAETKKDIKSQTYYRTNCKILDSNLKDVRTLSNDALCLPLEDGGWIATNNLTYLKRYSAEGETLWEKKGYFHHQLTLAADANILAIRKIEKNKILYDELCKIDVKTGKDLKTFSIYTALRKDKKKFKAFDRQPLIDESFRKVFDTNLEKLHINSISEYKDEIIVNDVDQISFILNPRFQFIRFLNFDFLDSTNENRVVHDLQKTSPTEYVIFKNFFTDHTTGKKTFKIYELDDNKIQFEFPLKTEDFVESDYSGGLEKIDDTYLVGFPMSNQPDAHSFVALISKQGHYIKKATLPYRIQDVKKIPFDEFMTKNKIK